MIEWSETQLSIRDAMRRFIEAEVKPRLQGMEHGDDPPYDVLRKLVATFGIADMARARFDADIERAQAGKAARQEGRGRPSPQAGEMMAMQMIPIIELCRYSPGLVTALGVSMGLTARSIMSKGTLAQKHRWALDLLTFQKIGAWAITEPGSGADAFGGMKATAKRDGDVYGHIGTNTFITNGRYADTIVFIGKLADGATEPSQRRILTFVLDKGMEGLTQSKPLRK